MTAPEAEFSTCFGAPFLPLPPMAYAQILGDKIAEHGADVWLVNTGWSGGPYGVGHRMSIAHTRALVSAILDGSLANVEYRADPVFGFAVPVTAPGVPSEVLVPRNTWADKAAYDAAAQDLVRRFTHQHAVPGAMPGVAYDASADQRSFAATRAFLAEALAPTAPHPGTARSTP